MVDFLDECQVHFGTKKLYEILGVEKTVTNGEIKSAYRKKSLKVHPDRAPENQKETAKEAFQTLSKVYTILSNEESRRVYDDTGIIVTDDDSSLNFESFEDAVKFWRQVFPKITTKQIDEFAEKYIGSEEEKNDLCDYYKRFQGDLDQIQEHHFFYEEDRVRNILQSLIDDGTLEPFDSFVNESSTKKRKRMKRSEKEIKDAEKEEKKRGEKNDGAGETDLVAAIMANRDRQWGGMVDHLEAKYGKKGNSKKSRLS